MTCLTLHNSRQFPSFPQCRDVQAAAQCSVDSLTLLHHVAVICTGMTAQSFEHPTDDLKSKKQMLEPASMPEHGHHQDQAEKLSSAHMSKHAQRAEHVSFRSRQNTTSPEAQSVVEGLIPVKSGRRGARLKKLLLVRSAT